MKRLIVLGSGAAPGVPSLSMGWGNCKPTNPYNIRTRTDMYVDYDGVKLLIDTSPDLRWHLIQNDIRYLDGVLYTHSHADHLHGIDDLREITRIRLDECLMKAGYDKHRNGVFDFSKCQNADCKSLDFYATKKTTSYIVKNFDYLIAGKKHKNNMFTQPSLLPHIVKQNQEFYVKELKIVPLKLIGHSVESVGYCFNDGELVYIADFKSLARSAYKQITVKPKILIVPLTTPFGQSAHAGLDEVLEVIKKIAPEKAILSHMASECDWEEINKRTPDFVTPAYDGMKIDF